MNPITEDIKDVLVRLGLGKFASTAKATWSIQMVSEPSEPNNTITVYDSPGRLLKYHNRDDAEAPGFLVRVRGETYLGAHEKMVEVCKALNKIGRFTLNGAKYENLFQDGTELFLKTDDNGRFIWIANFTAFREEAT